MPANSLPVDLHQAEAGYFGFRCAMVLLRLLLASLLFAPGLGAAPASDTVNERLPVSPAELEAHWNIDCRATWAALQALADGSGEGEQCIIGPESQRSLELCAFVYQPPGGVVSRTCPDYRAALDAAAGSTDGCAALAQFLQKDGRCLRSD